MAGRADDELTQAFARLGRDTANQRDTLESLVKLLRKRLGVGAVRVSRRGLWGFGKLESATFVVGDHSYSVTISGGKVVARIADAVGGVGLSHQPIGWDDWVHTLVAEIDATIAQNPEP